MKAVAKQAASKLPTPPPAPTKAVAKPPANKRNSKKGKKESQKKVEDGENAESKKITWTKELVEELVGLRYSEDMKASYCRCRSDTEKSAWWKRLAEEFSIAHNLSFETKQIRNKLDKLKAEYRSLCAASKVTGNPTETPIKYPAYWETLFSTLAVSGGARNFRQGGLKFCFGTAGEFLFTFHF